MKTDMNDTPKQEAAYQVQSRGLPGEGAGQSGHGRR